MYIILRMAKIKYTPKDLKQPDKFAESVGKAIDYTSSHSTKLVAALVVVIVALILIYVFSTFEDKNKIVASTDFDSAYELYKTGNNDEALQEFLSVAEKHSGSNLAGVSQYYAARIYYQTGKYQDAIATLDKFIKRGDNDKTLEESALLTQGLASFSLENWQQSIDYLNQIGPGSPYEQEAKLHMGLAYEKLGNAQKAQEIYEEIEGTTSGAPITNPVN